MSTLGGCRLNRHNIAIGTLGPSHGGTYKTQGFEVKPKVCSKEIEVRGDRGQNSN